MFTPTRMKCPTCYDRCVCVCAGLEPYLGACVNTKALWAPSVERFACVLHSPLTCVEETLRTMAVPPSDYVDPLSSILLVSCVDPLAGREQSLGVGCGPESDGNITGCVASRGIDDHRTYLGSFHRWCEVCKSASPVESRFYMFQGIPTLNKSRATLALPPHFTSGGCRQMCLPCDKDGNIAALAATYPAGDRLSGDRCRKLARDFRAL